MRTTLRIACLLGLLASHGSAQAPAAPAAQPAATPAQAAPAEAPAEASPDQAAPAANAEPSTAAPTGAAEAAEAAPPSQTEQMSRNREWARRAQQRAEIQLMLARARHAAEQRQRGQAHEREPEPEPARRHGDAGSAFALGLTFEMPWYTDPGYDAFADDDVAQRYGAFIAYDIAALRQDTILALELGWGSEHDEDDILGSADTELSSQRPYLGATIRWVPIDFIQPHLRLAGGVAIVDAEVRADGETFHEGGSGLFNDLISPFGSAGLGLTLRSPTRTFENRKGNLASLSFGLLIEGGYTLAKPLDIALDGPGPGSRDISLAESSLGELKRSGPYLRLALVGRI